jgi:hypothetical protein
MMVDLFLFLKVMTGALAPLSYLVSICLCYRPQDPALDNFLSKFTFSFGKIVCFSLAWRIVHTYEVV